MLWRQFTRPAVHALASSRGDRDSSRHVWIAEDGYPVDPAYREFYRDSVSPIFRLNIWGPIRARFAEIFRCESPLHHGRKGENSLLSGPTAEKEPLTRTPIHFVGTARAQIRARRP